MRLVANALACMRGGRTIFDNVGFELAAGESLFLTGPNGAGKTSLLRIIAGLLDAAGGTLDLERDDAALDLTIGQQGHFIGHLDAVKPALSVRENLEFWKQMLGEGDVEAGLHAFGLEAYAAFPAGLLSAGQRRRLALSRLKLVRRPLWLLDEPDVSIDRDAKADLASTITTHLEAGGLAIISSHGDLGFTPSHRLQLGREGKRR